MLQKMRRDAGLTLKGLIIICGVLLLIGALAIPGVVSSTGCSNERRAMVALRILISAEADFRTNDRDRNKVLDYWTADVKGLYTMTPATDLTAAEMRQDQPPFPKDQPLRLIESSVAAADGDDTFYPAGGENLPLTLFEQSSSRAGYWYVVLLVDNSIQNPLDRAYKTDTGGTPPMGPVHNRTRFGFLAFPHGPGSGREFLRLNEKATVFRHEPKVIPAMGFKHAPGLQQIPSRLLEWPTDMDLKKDWRKVD
jgi:hypothetical protein